MTIPFDSVRDIPLDTDSDLVDRLHSVLEGAMRRQVWLMFLDEDGRQLPMLYPSYLTQKPRKRDAPALGHFIRMLCDELEAEAVVVTYERRGRTQLSETDRVWLQCLRAACLAADVPFRGPFLLHNEGVVAVPPDDYSGSSPSRPHARST